MVKYIVAKLYCCDCRAAGLKMILRLARLVQRRAGKKITSGGTPIRLTIYSLLHRLALLLKQLVPCSRYIKISVSERGTSGLLVSIHFLATNGLSMKGIYKRSPICRFSYFIVLYCIAALQCPALKVYSNMCCNLRIT